VIKNQLPLGDERERVKAFPQNSSHFKWCQIVYLKNMLWQMMTYRF